MNPTAAHRITVCTSCKDTTTGTRPGADLIRALRAALSGTDDGLDAEFAVACMAGCTRSCTVGFHGAGKASYLFGDISADTASEDVNDLVQFARLYALLSDGWCSSVDRPGKLRRTTLARIPATLFATPQSPEPAP